MSGIRRAGTPTLLALAAALLALVVAALLAAFAASAFAAEPAGEDGSSVPGELIVVYDGGEGSRAEAIAGSLHVLFDTAPDPVDIAGAAAGQAVRDSDIDVSAIEDLGPIAGGDEGALLVTVAPGEPVDAAIAALERDPAVAYAQPNYTYHLLDDAPSYTIGSGAATIAGYALSAAIPDDPSFDVQARRYHLEPWHTTDAYSGANVLEAWERVKVEGTVTIAILDSGVVPTHEDLADNLDTAHMRDIYNDTAAGVIHDDSGHGTHVAGIAAGVANNGKGVAGVSYNAKILPLKVFSDGTSPTCSTAHLLAAFRYLDGLVESGELTDLHVINMSLGDYSSAANDQAFRSAIATMRDEHRVLSVCAGGNGDSSTGQPYTKPCYPSDFDVAVGVTSLMRNGTNWVRSDYNLAKDISAPGQSIYSTYRGSDSSYQTLNGSSLATPIVSGVAALLWAYNPGMSADQVVEAIKATAQPLDPAGDNYREPGVETGSVGCIDAAAALAYAEEHFPPFTDAVIAPIPAETYDGGALEPALAVTVGDASLVEGDDYTVYFAHNVDAGTATVTITGAGSYEGTVSTSFRIAPAPISGATVTGIVTRNCTGQACTQTPVVTYPLRDGTATLVPGTDYTLSYKNNVNPGTATVTITGKGNYTGSISRTFAINQVWHRVWGPTAADTMQLIASERGTSATHAIVTSDTSYKDALAASSLAGHYGGIVLMTKKGSLTPQARVALQASGVKTVFIVGSTANVSNAAQDAIRKVPGVKNVWRVNGTTPSQRAVAIAKKTAGRSDTVIIATQNDYRDALSIAPYAYATKSPILYAEADKRLSAETTAFLKGAGYKRALIIGGPLALPASVEMQLRVSGIRQANITRLAGANAYETSTQVATWATGNLEKGSYGTYKGGRLAYVRFKPDTTLGVNKLAVATGQDWRDAVCGAALCGRNRSVMLLADSKTAKSNYSRAVSFCTEHRSQIKKAYVFGGTSAVSAKVWNALLATTK